MASEVRRHELDTGRTGINNVWEGYDGRRQLVTVKPGASRTYDGTVQLSESPTKLVL